MDKPKDTKITKKILVWGVVQGVGFRPFVFRCAKNNSIMGTVANVGGYVEIIAQASSLNIDKFIDELTKKNIGNWKIKSLEQQTIKRDKYLDFSIIKSEQNENISIVPPDLSICPDCHRELFDKQNRRYENPFISCSYCGPRYTIIESLPYDRQNTSMKNFEMCDECNAEYKNPQDRRFHAQTISCHNCGPYLILEQNNNQYIKQLALEKTIEIIKSGGIVAIKGIGGYLFVCSVFNEKTLCNLRVLKNREQKPFAVMFENLDEIKKQCYVNEIEEQTLLSKQMPIVLLLSKENSEISVEVTKGSVFCGAFLPNSPLQALLVKKCGPLVMTSANFQDEPIIKDEQKIFSIKSPLLNGVLYNEREIIRSVDDSVVKIVDKNVQIIRRSRGYTPYPIFLPKSKERILATGSDLKSTFCLTKGDEAIVSQFFGDLENNSVFELYKNSFLGLQKLYKIKLDKVVCDLHPNFHSTRLAKSLGIPVLELQHHHAHIASVIAENNIRNELIGVCFDGTGYGEDGNIWGGEFFVWDKLNFKRIGHLAYTPIIGGDLSMKDCKKTAACYLIENDLEQYINDERKNIIKASMINKINTVLTSSAGRLFDAISAIIGIKTENDFEGQAAQMLEKEAFLAIKAKKQPVDFEFEILKTNDMIISSPKPLLKKLCELKEKEDIGAISLGFHTAVSKMILKNCLLIREQSEINSVALSGGVFQNSILMEETLNLLRENDFFVFYNKLVPPNDSGISLGQAFMGQMR